MTEMTDDFQMMIMTEVTDDDGAQIKILINK